MELKFQWTVLMHIFDVMASIKKFQRYLKNVMYRLR